jgi:hypothetical protein
LLTHFSEDPSIEIFTPRVPSTGTTDEPLVWAIDAAHAPSYWFPRDCPRACCWRLEGMTLSPAGATLLGTTAHRLHVIEREWLDRVARTRLYAYKFDSRPFELSNADAGYWTTEETVRPLSVDPVGDLLAKHRGAGIELRVVSDLWPVIDAIVGSGLGFSIIRKQNARARCVTGTTVQDIC